MDALAQRRAHPFLRDTGGGHAAMFYEAPPPGRMAKQLNKDAVPSVHHGDAELEQSVLHMEAELTLKPTRVQTTVNLSSVLAGKAAASALVGRLSGRAREAKTAGVHSVGPVPVSPPEPGFGSAVDVCVSTASAGTVPPAGVEGATGIEEN